MYFGKICNFFYRNKDEWITKLPKVKRLGRTKPLMISILNKYYIISSSSGKLIKVNNKLLNSSFFNKDDVINYVSSFKNDLNHQKSQKFLSPNNIQRGLNQLRKFDAGISKNKRSVSISKINTNFSCQKSKKVLETNIKNIKEKGFNINNMNKFSYKSKSTRYIAKTQKSFLNSRNKLFKKKITDVSLTNDNLSSNDNYKLNSTSKSVTKIKLKIKPKTNYNDYSIKDNIPKTSRDEDNKLEINLANVRFYNIGKNDIVQKMFPNDESLEINENDTMIIKAFKNQLFKERVQKKLREQYNFLGDNNRTENQIQKITLKNLLTFGGSSILPQKRKLINQKMYFEHLNYHKNSNKIKTE